MGCVDWTVIQTFADSLLCASCSSARLLYTALRNPYGTLWKWFCLLGFWSQAPNVSSQRWPSPPDAAALTAGIWHPAWFMGSLELDPMLRVLEVSDRATSWVLKFPLRWKSCLQKEKQDVKPFWVACGRYNTEFRVKSLSLAADHKQLHLMSRAVLGC